MKIVCPQCAFARNVPDDRMPSAAVIATCPHCQHRFKVERPGTAQPEAAPSTDSAPLAASPKDSPSPQPPVLASQAAAHHAEEDDPLPPGAVIPRGQDDVPPPVAKEHEDNQRPSNEKHESPKPSHSLGRNAVPAPGTPDMPSEEDIEYRRAAAAAYEKQAEEGSEDFALDNPWEQPERDGYAASFYQTCMRVMFAAPRFFSGLRPDTPQRTALFFFLLVCVFQTLVERFWGGVFSSYFAEAASNDPQLQKLLGMLTPQSSMLMSLLMNAAFKTMELFVATALFSLAFRLMAPDKANYQLTFQVMAYSTAPALLCVVPVAGSVAGFIWGMACSLVGCRYALRITWSQAVLGILPLYGLGVLLLLRLTTNLQQAILG